MNSAWPASIFRFLRSRMSRCQSGDSISGCSSTSEPQRASIAARRSARLMFLISRVSIADPFSYPVVHRAADIIDYHDDSQEPRVESRAPRRTPCFTQGFACASSSPAPQGTGEPRNMGRHVPFGSQGTDHRPRTAGPEPEKVPDTVPFPPRTTRQSAVSGSRATNCGPSCRFHASALLRGSATRFPRLPAESFREQDAIPLVPPLNLYFKGRPQSSQNLLCLQSSVRRTQASRVCCSRGSSLRVLPTREGAWAENSRRRQTVPLPMKDP